MGGGGVEGEVFNCSVKGRRKGRDEKGNKWPLKQNKTPCSEEVKF